jgi:ribosomal-protein-alanine N-acetyltransferase
MQLMTARLILREFEEGDVFAMHQLESDPEVVKYVSYGPSTEEECRRDLAFHIEHQTAQLRRSYHLAICSPDVPRLIGWCGLKITGSRFQEAELGYALQRQYWGQGYITEAANALLSYGFTQLRLHRIFATCDPRNIGSAHVLEKNGMQREGHLHQNKWCKGAWRDSLIYAVLEREWHEN